MAGASAEDSEPVGAPLEAGLPLRTLERRLLVATLEATGGNRTRTAEMLGISLRTVRNKIRAYGLPPREPRRAAKSPPGMEPAKEDRTR